MPHRALAKKTEPAPLFQFHPATTDDLPLLRRWIGHPHVRRWWDADDPYGPQDLADPRVARWIVSYLGRPFGYMQDYAVHGWDQHHFGHLAEGARGIDQFIGEPDMMGQGHGTAFIRQRMTTLFRAGIPVIATDPHPENERAIAVYRKLGFQISGPPQHSDWGLILPMIAHPALEPLPV